MYINYDEIDELCRPIVKFFNEVGLTTKFSCQGHDCKSNNEFHIMFHESVTDDMISEFISKYSSKYNHTPFIGKFSKWIRKCNGEIIGNWEYRIGYGNYLANQSFAELDLETMKNVK